MRLRWVAVYNANLDRSAALRKRAVELRSEMRRWEEDKRGSRKEPLKTDITEYRVRICLLSLGGLGHNQALRCSAQTKQSLINLSNSLDRKPIVRAKPQDHLGTVQKHLGNRLSILL